MIPLRRTVLSLVAAGLSAGSAQAQYGEPMPIASPAPYPSRYQAPDQQQYYPSAQPQSPYAFSPQGYYPTAQNGMPLTMVNAYGQPMQLPPGGMGMPAPQPAASTTMPDAASGPANLGPATSAFANTSNVPRVWGSAEALYWWIKDNPLPILVTTGNPADPIPGAPGQPGTRPVHGTGAGFDPLTGIRVTVGGWIDSNDTFGFEVSGFSLLRETVGYSAGSADATGNPATFLPLLRPETNSERPITVSAPVNGGFPPLLGNVSISSRFELWGAEGNELICLRRDECTEAVLLLGIRYLDMKEQTQINTALDNNFFDIHSRFSDAFNTRNQFLGGQVGGRLSRKFNIRGQNLCIDATAKVALGANYEVVTVSGSNVESGAGVPNGRFPGGVFAQASNSGRQAHNEFAVLPQAQVKVSYALIRQVSVFAGYDLLYLSDVVRPGDQISRTVSFPVVPGGPQPLAAPASTFHRSDFLAHGMSVGFVVKF